MPGGDLPTAAQFGVPFLCSNTSRGQAFPLSFLGFQISGFWDRDRLMQQVISVRLDAAALTLLLLGAMSKRHHLEPALGRTCQERPQGFF
jgi:hypothetical protein